MVLSRYVELAVVPEDHPVFYGRVEELLFLVAFVCDSEEVVAEYRRFRYCKMRCLFSLLLMANGLPTSKSAVVRSLQCLQIERKEFVIMTVGTDKILS